MKHRLSEQHFDVMKSNPVLSRQVHADNIIHV